MLAAESVHTVGTHSDRILWRFESGPSNMVTSGHRDRFGMNETRKESAGKTDSATPSRRSRKPNDASEILRTSCQVM
jgi:hypothetical protein